MKSRVVLLLVAVVVAFTVDAQEISVQNTNPPSLRWNRIRTTHFSVLFPNGFDRQAQRVINTLEYIREPESISMGARPKPITIILQNQTSISNGFVTLAPRRSEFFTMQPQNYNFIGSNDWLSLLASHEYRHVVQYQRSIVGFNKFVYYLFGQQALSLTAFAAAPQWFWEGDAVATETAFTNSGRGRIPYFNLVFRTNLLEGRTFNYHKQYLRSYKNNIPDHYVLGYHMITYLRNYTHDADIWDKVATRSWSYPFIPFAFSRSIRKETGMNVMSLYRNMADSLRGEWQREVDGLKLTKFKRINQRTTSTYTDFLYPQPQQDGSVIALVTGIGNITSVVRLKLGRVDQEFVTGPFNESGMLSAVGDKAVWNEYRYDPRWRMRTYSVVQGYDFGARKRKTITHHSRLGSAALSPDGQSVATIESGNDYAVRLKVIDYSTGAEKFTFADTTYQMISMPRWSNDGQSIVFIGLTAKGKTISQLSLSTNTAKVLYEAGQENVGHPVLNGDHLFYNSPYSGIDNIYMLQLSSRRRYQVTSSKYGAYNPAISHDGEWIIYNDQTRDGMDIVQAPYDVSQFTPIESVAVPMRHFYDALVEQEQHADIMKDVPSTQHPTTKYNRLASMINVHSWGPFFSSDVTQADIGISSRNLLGTTNVNAGYLFDINERTGSYHAGLSYQGLLPIFDFNFLGGSRQNKTSIFDRSVKFTWDETTVNGGVRIPLVLTKSKYNVNLTLKNVVGVTQVSNLRNEVTKNNVLISSGTERYVNANDTLVYIFDNQVGTGKLYFNQFAFSFSRFLKQSRRDFNPKWAQLLDVEYYSTPYGGDFQGSLFAVRSAMYFPGFAKHHSIVVRGGYQEGTSGLEVNRYSFRNRVFRPRGFSYPKDTRFQSLSINYALPLWYPDLALGPLVNVQRLRANAFADYGQAVGRNYFYGPKNRVYYSTSDRSYNSFGVEMTVDVNVMRLLPQLDLGVRTTYLNVGPFSANNLVVEFVLGTLNL